MQIIIGELSQWAQFKKWKKENPFAYQATMQRALMLIMFFIFKVILPMVDIVTDVITAQSFFQNGHPMWGRSTIIIIFLPFIAKILIEVYTVVYNKYRKNDTHGWKTTLTNILTHFPLIIPIR